jgi:predicted short-subunit dehydrogenase-like oxidoreductase (DUF2520 family)
VSSEERSGFVFIGAGAVGTALAVLLRDEGMKIRAVASRRELSARRAAAILGGAQVVQSPVEAARLGRDIFITTPDETIGELAVALADAGAVESGCRVIHMSGALGLEPLAPIAAQGVSVGGFHPLQVFATWERGRELIPGSTIGIEAPDEETRTYLFGLAARVRAHPVAIPPGARALYHAGAVCASNYVVAVVAQAVDLLVETGLSSVDAIRMLMPLARGALETIPAEGDASKALTGPIVRGEIEIVRSHIDTIRATVPDALPLYLELGRKALHLARRRRTLDRKRERALEELLEID